MASTNIYQDIATRTGGDIYIGVVGPVRTGKSTFIRKTMEHLVIDNIADPYVRQRTIDELPQASAGKTIMTTEPKFVPENAIQIELGENNRCNIRMVDCVGFVVDGAIGQYEDDLPRMINTPWNDEEISFAQAAEIGTRKVINEHSTISVVITTDGSIGDIPRNDYISAEQKVISEMKATGKPFVVVLNTMFPNGEQTSMIQKSMENTYGVPVIVKNCNELTKQDVEDVLFAMLMEFPITKISLNIPGWITQLPANNEVKKNIYDWMRSCCQNRKTIRAIQDIDEKLCENQYITTAMMSDACMGDGHVTLDVGLDNSLYFGMVSDILGCEINDDGDLLLHLRSLAEAKNKYDKIKTAFESAQNSGYGIVTPERDDLQLEKPVSYRQGSRYGIKIKATAPTYHVIKADIISEISPIVGDEEQSGTLIEFMNGQYDNNISEIWNYDIFGKTIYSMVYDGLQSKFERLPDDARCKLQETLSRVLNEGSGGLICIIL